MQYKTIILELIQQRPELHERLKFSKTMLAFLDRHANLLKASHNAWTNQLRQSRPETGEIQVASEAMEHALKEIEMILPNGSEPDETETLSLDEAILFLRKRNPLE